MLKRFCDLSEHKYTQIGYPHWDSVQLITFDATDNKLNFEINIENVNERTATEVRQKLLFIRIEMKHQINSIRV